MTGLLTLAALLVVQSTATLPAAEGAHPNFVFIITDDIGSGDVGFDGNTQVKTPHLDALARQGLVFENAYNVISSCSPSRCSIITGRYPHNTSAPELHLPLPASQTTFIQLLQAAGYHTMISGKNHMGKPEQLGFVESSNSSPSGAEKWVQHLRDRPRDKPFFAWFASHDAHHPFQLNGQAPHYDPATIDVPPMLYDGPETRKELAEYYHEVSRTDHFVGLVNDELKSQGIAGQTYLIYCSDNGRPFPRCKTYLFDSGVKTPLLIVGPGIPAARTRSIVSSIDYSATILELAGIRKPECVQGASFAAVLRNPETQVREVAFAERNWHVFQSHQRMVRFGDWLYSWNAWPDRYSLSGESAWTGHFPAAGELWAAAESGKLTPAQALITQRPQPAEMLFRVDRDRHQFENLVADPSCAAALERARSLLHRWTLETCDSVPEHPTPDRGAIHEATERNVKRGELPGAARDAARANAPGPVRLEDPKESS